MVLFFFSIPFVFWLLNDNLTNRVLVIDKSVPNDEYREHSSLAWTLNHLKTSPPGRSRPWKDYIDYIGYYPERVDENGDAETEDLTAKHLENIDLLFIADSYGVYRLDLEGQPEDLTALDYSQLIYGGMDDKEVKVIQDFVDRGGDFIAEFNTFASPTYGRARRTLEKILWLKWSGWAGRFFEDLDNEDEVPEWARRNYKKHYGREWDFTGRGILMAHEDTRIFVLEEEKDIESRGLRISVVRPHDPLMKNVLSDVPFYYWFDIVYARPGSEVLARFDMLVTQSGREKLKKFNIYHQFPAIIRATRKPLAIYFAGDFSDNKVDEGPYNMLWALYFKRFLRLIDHYPDQRGFFWELYLPMMMNIFDTENYGKVEE